MAYSKRALVYVISFLKRVAFRVRTVKLSLHYTSDPRHSHTTSLHCRSNWQWL